MIFIKKTIPYLLTLFMVLIMMGCSLLINNPEIIFPEIVTLTIGTWLAPKQVWKTSPVKLVGLILIYSVLGIVMVKYVDIPLYLKITAAFFMCAVGLIMSHTTFSPLISACLLPILMETESWIYPFSATLMTLIIVIIQSVLQHYKYQEYTFYRPVKVNPKKDTIILIERMIIIMVISAIAIYFDLKWLIAPPLIVAFVEISHPQFPLKHQLPSIYMLTVIMALIGAYSRHFLIIKYHFSFLGIVAAVMVILFIVIGLTHIFFPPMGAITILPFIIDPEYLLLYPVFIAGSFLLLIIFACLISFHGKSSLS